MKEASKALADNVSNNIAVSSTVVNSNGQRICKAGEDEAFDNCVIPQEKDQD